MFSLADYVILVICGLSSMLSLWRGFVKEAISLGAWVTAFGVTGNFYSDLCPKLTFVDDAMVRTILAMVILFVISLLVVGLCGNVLRALISKAGLTGTDRLLGVAFGAVRGILIVCALLALLQILFKLHLFTFLQDEIWWQQSLFIPELQKIVSWFFVYLGSPIGE